MVTRLDSQIIDGKGAGSPGRIRTSNISVNSWGLQTLNALFGVAYDLEHLSPDPQLGNFWATKWVKKVSGGSK